MRANEVGDGAFEALSDRASSRAAARHVHGSFKKFALRFTNFEELQSDHQTRNIPYSLRLAVSNVLDCCSNVLAEHLYRSFDVKSCEK